MRKFVMALAAGAVLLIGGTALAGDIKFGEKALETDKAGKLTDAGSKAAVTELKNTGPDDWMLHVWAKLDGAKPGPLELEFWGEIQGKRYSVWKHIHNDFTGGKYVSLQVKLEGKSGFNKDRSYDLEITQGEGKKKLAKGTFKLLKPKSEEVEAKEAEEAEDDQFDEEVEAGVDDAVPMEEDEPPAAMPPMTEEPPVSRSKGCRIADEPWPPSAVWFLAVLALRRRDSTRALMG